MNIKENYQQYVSRYASEVAALKRKNTGFITGELLAFGGILAFLICYFALDGDTQSYLMGAILCLIAYLGIRRLDDKNKEKIEHLSALLKVYQDEIKAWEGDFSPFETGDSYQNPQHPYSFDLDVFGKSSLGRQWRRQAKIQSNDNRSRRFVLNRYFSYRLSGQSR